MLSLSPFKILVVAGVVMLLLGPDKLPEVAHRLGTAWRSLKKLQSRIEEEVRDAIPDLPKTSELAKMARSPVNLLNSLADRVGDKGQDDAEASTSVPTVETQPATLNISSPPDPSLN